MSPSPLALPTERHRKCICGNVRVTVSGALSLELSETGAESEGIREVSVGPKKKVSSSGCAVRSKMRGDPWAVDSGRKAWGKCNGWNKRPTSTGTKASITYKPAMWFKTGPHGQRVSGRTLRLAFAVAHAHTWATRPLYHPPLFLSSCPLSDNHPLTTVHPPLSTYAK